MRVEFASMDFSASANDPRRAGGGQRQTLMLNGGIGMFRQSATEPMGVADGSAVAGAAEAAGAAIAPMDSAMAVTANACVALLIMITFLG
ncbi:hypothetical protein [Nocardia sp. NBC_01377]|uniref:hypothetical protein n=1 Tax=Nocardia sp. NBC_01377 TaxID=2903595 RepID=UPI00386DE956